MKPEYFHISLDPHPQGILRLAYQGKPFQVWDYETMAEPISLRWAIGIVDQYSCRRGFAKSSIYFDLDALEYVKKRITAMEQQLQVYQDFMASMKYPQEETAAVRQHSNRQNKESSDQKIVSSIAPIV